MRNNRILWVILIALLIFTAGEVGYYFSYISLGSPDTQAINKAKFIPTTKNNTAYRKLTASAEAAINPKMLERLKNYIKSPESHLYIYSEQTAKVLQVAENGATVEDRRDGKLYPGKILFPLAIQLSNKAMPEGYIWMYFHDPVIQRTKVYYRSKGQTPTKASIRDIKAGDTITTIEIWDPSVEPDMKNLQETLTKQVVDYTIYIEK